MAFQRGELCLWFLAKQNCLVHDTAQQKMDFAITRYMLPLYSPGWGPEVQSVLSAYLVVSGWKQDIGLRLYVLILKGALLLSLRFANNASGDWDCLPFDLGSSLLSGAVVRRVRALRQVLGEITPDVIISFLSRTNILTLLSSRGLDIPVIISERNNPNMQHLGFTWNFLRSVTYRRAFGMVTMTKAALRFFPESMRVRSWVIPNPVIIPRDLPKKQIDSSRKGKS